MALLGFPSCWGSTVSSHSGSSGVPSTHRGPSDLSRGPTPKPNQSFLELKCQFKFIGPGSSAQSWLPELNPICRGMRVQPGAPFMAGI